MKQAQKESLLEADGGYLSDSKDRKCSQRANINASQDSKLKAMQSPNSLLM